MMKPLAPLLSALVLAALCAGPALAQKNGSGNGSERSEAASSNSNSNSNSNNNGGNAASGNGSSGNSSSGNSNSGNSNAGGGNSGSRGNSGGNAGEAAGGGPDPDGIVQLPREQQLVQSAVRAGAALPLEDILAIVAQDSDGRVLDLELVRFKGSYLYAVTVLEQNGILHRLYYYARSGRRVRQN